MPQMAPISWLTLYMMFFLIFMIFNALNYYCFNNKASFTANKDKVTTFKLNWKW